MKLFLLASCCMLLLSGSTSPSPVVKNSSDTITNTPIPANAELPKGFIPDSSVNNKFFLNDGASIYRAFGIIDSLLQDVDGDGFTEMYVKNRSGSQYLKMIQHLGCPWNAISEFEFGYTADLPDSIHLIASDMALFFTGSGISLGMPQLEVIRAKGPGYTKKMINKKESVISYIMKHWEGSLYLKRYKMDIYYARFTFKKGKVTQVKFGFDYF